MSRFPDKSSSIVRVAVFAAVCMAVFGGEQGLAQLHAVKVFGDYSTALSKRLEVTSASAWGGGFEIDYAVTEVVGVRFVGGYAYYSIDQPNAIENWNWKFWVDRYRGIVAANLASDPALSATLTPQQIVEATPVALMLALRVPLVEGLTVDASGGGGILFFTRKLYIQEEWRKRFQAVDYDFEYSYLNFANPKPGSPWYLVGGAELRYALSSLFECTVGGRFTYVIRTKGKRGYDHIPFRSTAALQLGLNILY